MKDFLYLVQIDEITFMDPEKPHVFQLLFILADGLILPVLIAYCMNQAASVVRLDIDDILDIFKDSLPIAADSQPFYRPPAPLALQYGLHPAEPCICGALFPGVSCQRAS